MAVKWVKWVSAEISVQTVNHLGIIAGLVDEIDLVEQIDQFLGRHPKKESFMLTASNTVRLLFTIWKGMR